MYLIEFLKLLNNNFFNANLYFIGGASRNIVLKKNLPQDLDFSIDIEPNEIEGILNKIKNSFEVKNNKVFIKIITIGKEFGTISLYVQLLNEDNELKNYSIEITSARQDVKCFGRSANVKFCKDFKVDSQRRDFTINAIYISLKSFLEKEENYKKKLQILDFHNGLLDLKLKKIIFIGNAKERIEEDYLRIVRYIRFCCLFKDKIDSNIKKIIIQNIENLKVVSKERKRKEIYTILSYKNYIDGIVNLINCKILDLKINNPSNINNKKLQKNDINTKDLNFICFIRLMNLIFESSNIKNFINNILYLKDNILLEKEEYRIADFYIKNIEIINFLFKNNLNNLKSDLKSVKVKIFKKALNNADDFFSKEQNWYEFISFVNKFNIFDGKIEKSNIKYYIRNFYIFTAIDELAKEGNYFFYITKDIKRYNILVKMHNYFSQNKQKISNFMDKIDNKSKIGKYISMSIMI